MQQLAEILLEKEVIFSDDLEGIFGKRPWEGDMEIPSRKEEIPSRKEKIPELKEKATNGKKKVTNEKEKTTNTEDPKEKKPEANKNNVAE